MPFFFQRSESTLDYFLSTYKFKKSHLSFFFFRVKTWALKFGIEASGGCAVATCVRKITEVSGVFLQ